MTNFSINFSNPWLLFLLIPAFALTFIPYFRSNKRYRRTRNRIVSIVLHLIIMVLSISVLSGISIEYDVPNEENEVIILVDSSFSNEEQQNAKNEFIQDVILSNNSAFKLGIVTFGYDQVYAVPLTDNMNTAYNDYLKAPAPDNSATDIEAALLYAHSLFNYPESSRIVLLSDAAETDGAALDVIKSIAGKGTKVDTVFFKDEMADSEVQIIGMELPETKVTRAEPFDIQLVVEGSYIGSAVIVPYDNDVAGESITIDLSEGIQNIKIPFTFSTPGLHTLRFELTSNGDTLTQNNTYISYIYVESYNNVVIFESQNGESDAIVRMLGEEFQTTVFHILDDIAPKTVEELRNYDEVILVNISNDDMPDGFDQMLHTYVNEVGGGLFTVCGNEPDDNPGDGEWTANAYNKEDMKGTLYQKLLPVEIIDYTPPVAVMILIDSSGSMIDLNNPEKEEGTRLYYAKQGAEACLQMLSDRDYMGVYSLADFETEQLMLTPVTQRDSVLAAISRIEGGGGTIFSTGIEEAGDALLACSNVEKRHIIIITDGEPNPDDVERTQGVLLENAKNGITTSVIGVEASADASALMKTLLVEYAKVTAENYHSVYDLQKVPEAIRQDLAAPEIKDVNYETYKPTIKVTTSITEGITEENMPTLDGFYGMKPKDKTEENQLEVILSTEYTPLYTKWVYGEGRVGTFACDLNGTWSSAFIDTAEGTQILRNIVSSLLPVKDIRIKSIDIEVKGDNYKTDVNIYSDLGENEYFEVTVVSPAKQTGGLEEVQKFTADKTDNYTKITFYVSTPGIHTITAVRKNSAGVVLAQTTAYKALAYSKEYDEFYDREAAQELIGQIAADGKGALLESPWQVYDNAANFLHKVINPTIVFIIIVICLFLLDIAVRKFKWKWIHELVRDKRAKAAMKSGQSTK